MKKIKIVAVVVALVLVAAGGVYFLLSKDKGPEIEKILPEKPLVYLRADKIGENLDVLHKTRLWQELEKIDYAGTLRKTNLLSGEFQQFFARPSALNSPARDVLLSKFFGREVAVAIYPLDDDSVRTLDAAGMVSHAVFATRLKPEARFFDLLTAVFSKVNKKVDERKVVYRDNTIHLVKTEGPAPEIGYVRIKDLLIFGVGEAPARRCLDVYLDGQKGLGKDKDYLQVKSRYLSGAEVTAYFNIRLLNDEMNRHSADILAHLKDRQAAEMLQKRMDENFRELRGFYAAGFSAVYDLETPAKLDILFEKKDLSAGMKSLYACPPSENETLGFVPKDALGYQWNGCYDFAYYWEQARLSAQQARRMDGETPGLTDFLENIGQTLQVDIEKDVLALVGREVGGYLLDVDTTAIFPLPQLVFFVKVTDVRAAGELIDKLILQQPFFRPQRETYQGHDIQYVIAPLISALQPGFTFFNNYLVIGSHRKLLRQMIDVAAGPALSLKNNERVRTHSFTLAGKNNFVFFVHLGELMRDALSLVDWGEEWMNRQTSRQEAFRTGQEKRLEDVHRKIEELEQKITQLKGQMAVLPAEEAPRKDAADTEQVSLDELEKTILWKEKLAESIEEKIPSLEKERSDLIAARDQLAGNEDFLFPPEGEKRLKEVEDEIASKLDNVRDIRGEILDLERQKSGAQRAVLTESLSGAQKDLEREKASVIEIEQLMDQYKKVPLLKKDDRRILLQEVVVPTLKALSALQYFASKVVLKEDVVEVLMMLKME